MTKLKKTLILLLLAISFVNLFSQSGINIYCNEIKRNGKSFPKGDDFKKSIESVLSNLDRPPRIIERDKLNSILEFIQDEENILRDMDQRSKDVLQTAQVDYLLYGNFTTSPFNDSVYFQIECIKISGKHTLSKFGFSTIPFSETDLSNPVVFERKLRNTLNGYSFVEDLGLIENEILNALNLRLDEKDREILTLRSKVNAIMEYSDMAEMDISGLGKIKGGSGITISSKLSKLMNKALEKKEDKVYVIFNEQAELAIEQVLTEFPRFPFGYHVKAMILKNRNDSRWREFARKAVEILEKTTMISGHHINHDEVLYQLRAHLNKF